METAEPCKNVIEALSVSLKIPLEEYFGSIFGLVKLFCVFFPKARIEVRMNMVRVGAEMDQRRFGDVG